jgi:xanthine dehydrogenase accessory factor
MSDILEEIYRCLAAGGELVLAAIVEHHGSTPRTAGAKMIVYDGGASSGTIGGGAVEAAVIEAALKIFQTKQNALLHFDLSRAGQSGCTGSDLRRPGTDSAGIHFQFS